ncbi:MAG: hypothetical protein V1750_05910 [Acidobacteriota bacterium]
MAEQPRSPVRLLIASSDAVYRRYLADRLRSCGIEVLPWEEGDKESGERLDASRVDVLLVETHGLDDADWALIEEVRDRAPLIEIIAISSDPQVENAVQALRSGVFEILTYPVSDSHLVNAITSACSRKRYGEDRIKATERRTS